MHLLKRAILKTLAYSDVFDFPLTKDEIWKYLINENFKSPISNIQFQKELKSIKQYISFQDGYFCFKGREEIINKRKKRSVISKKKLFLANKIAKKLSLIPTVDLVAISGSLAMENAEEKDDIDFFIISRSKTIWTTRLFVTILLEFLGVRRRKHAIFAPNKICLNMFMDNSKLTLPVKRQTNYSAHEIAQMKIIFDRNNAYKKFLSANSWVKKFLPNAFNNIPVSVKTSSQTDILFLFENLSKFFQKWYSARSRVDEEITDTLLAFHPINREEIIQEELQNRVKKYEI